MKMRICHASNFLIGCHKKTGGAETACYLISKGLEKRKFTNYLICLKPDKEQSCANLFTPYSMENILGKKIGRLYKIFLPFDPLIYLSAKNHFKKIKPDLLHLHNFNFLSLALIFSAVKFRIPIVYSIYDYWAFCPIQRLAKPDNTICEDFHGIKCRKCLRNRKFGFLQTLFVLIRKPLFNSALKKIALFITLSEHSKEVLIKYGIPQDKIKTIHLPMLNMAQLKKPGKIERNSILFAGWIEKHKGLDILLRAMPGIIRKILSVKLYALGMSSSQLEKQRIEKQIRQLKIEKKVFFSVEKLPQKEFQTIFAKASIVAVPEQWINMSPLMVFEAMSYSKPIVASNIGGIPEFVKEDINGKLVKADDIKEWENAICSILTDNVKLKKMCLNSGKIFKDIYNDKIIFKDLIREYIKINENESK